MPTIRDEWIDLSDASPPDLATAQLPRAYRLYPLFLWGRDFKFRVCEFQRGVANVGGEVESIAFPKVWDDEILSFAQKRAEEAGFTVAEPIDLPSLTTSAYFEGERDKFVITYRLKRIPHYLDVLLGLKKRRVPENPNISESFAFGLMSEETFRFAEKIFPMSQLFPFFESGNRQFELRTSYILAFFENQAASHRKLLGQIKTKIGMHIHVDHEFETLLSRSCYPCPLNIEVFIDNTLPKFEVRDISDDLVFNF